MSANNTHIGYEHTTTARENRIDSTLSDSFPASDPPDWTGIARIGCPARLDPSLGEELIMSYTSDEQFAACARSDNVLDFLLGKTLQQAVLRMAVLSTLAGVVVVYLLPIVI
ncbi:MAG TPA: hypothetical protein VEU53_09725 [Stellaceae bacterium]|nr:hypothetical protein [Stellaceae bacterium]